MAEKDLVQLYLNGKISRRGFLKMAGLMGLSLSGASSLLAACGPAAPQAATTAPPTAGAGAGAGADTVTVATSEAVTGNWDPPSHTNLGQLIVENSIFDNLFRTPCPPDNPTKSDPQLALSWKTLDASTWEFKLREGVKFHNGADFTAEDVKATVEYYSNDKAPMYFLIANKYTGEVVDKYTVRVKSTQPSGSAFWGLAWMRVMSAADIQNPKVLADRPNGTGPYKYVAQELDSTNLTLNTQYWETPKVKNLNYRYIGDVNTRLLALLAGEVDAAERLNPEQVPVAEQSGNITVQVVQGIEPVYVHFRDSKPPFKDNEKLRLAMAHGIDRNAVLAILGQAGYAIQCHYTPGHIGYIDLPDFPQYDPAKARALLAEAGYPDGKGLPTLEFNSPVGRYPKDKEWATLITAQWQSLGIPVKLIVGDPAAWGDKLYNPDQGHMITCGWGIGNPDPNGFLWGLWKGGMSVIPFLNDPEVDASLVKENSATDPAEREKIIQTETLPLLARKMPSIPMAGHRYLTGVNNRVKGFIQEPSSWFNVTQLEKTA